MHKDKYFFSYSFLLTKFLVDKKGFRFVCEAKNRNDLRTFWLFERTEELNNALIEYKRVSNEFLNDMRKQYKGE